MQNVKPGLYGLALLAVFGGWFVLSWPWLSGAVTIPYDAKAHFQPQLQFLAHALHSGQSPFWNPHIFAGSPQIADPQSLIFSPAVLVALFDATPSFRALDTYVLFLLLSAALSIVMFFKERNWHPAGATAAALAFAFGASAAWRIQHIKQVQSLAFFAVSLWLLERALRSGKASSGIVAGVAVAFMIMEAGQVALLCGYFLTAYVLVRVVSLAETRQRLGSMITALLVCVGTVVVLAGIPILLTYDFVAASNRADISLAGAVHGSLHPASLLTAVIGDLFAAGIKGVNYWGPPSPTWNGDGLALAQNMCEIYSGALSAVALVGFGLARGLIWRREIAVFVAGLVVACLYAVGWYTPAFKLFYETVPFVHLFRRPADATFLIGAMLAISGGYVVHLAASEGFHANRRATALTTTMIVTVFAVGVAIAVTMGHQAQAAYPLALSAFLSMAAAQLLHHLSRISTGSPSLAVYAVAALMTVDLGLINGPNGSTGLAPENYQMLQADGQEPTIKYLKDHLAVTLPSSHRDRTELAGLGFEWPNASMVHGFDHVLGYNPLRLTSVTSGVGAGDTIAVPQQRQFTPLFPSYDSTLANMLGLRFIVSKVPIEQIDKRLPPNALRLVGNASGAFIYENPHALPRVMFTAEWRVADFQTILQTGGWPSFDPERTVLLDIPSSSARELTAIGLRPAEDRATLVRYANSVVDIEVDAVDEGFVVLNDVYHPWWYATVDGRETPVFRANVMFRAVEIPAGHHHVRFEFQPIRGALAQIYDRVWPRPDPEPHAPPRPADASIVMGHAHSTGSSVISVVH